MNNNSIGGIAYLFCEIIISILFIFLILPINLLSFWGKKIAVKLECSTACYAIILMANIRLFNSANRNFSLPLPVLFSARFVFHILDTSCSVCCLYASQKLFSRKNTAYKYGRIPRTCNTPFSPQCPPL